MSEAAIFPPDARAAFAALYPTRAGKLAHGLAGHPLLTLDALAALAEALPAGSAEWNPGTLPIGVDPGDVPRATLGVGETIRGIDTSASWVVLKRIEQVPAYAALLRAALAELEAVATPRTGAMHQLEGFVFVSSPGSVTPFHFDPEHNILLQLRGTKTLTVFPGGDERLLSAEAQEAFHLGQHHRNLPWNDAFAALGEAVHLAPGEAVHVPVKAPHWVRNGPAPSISLSITWRSEWSYAEADARAFNRVLRGMGMRPRRPGAFPAANRGKALAWRAMRRLGVGG
ncbi:cupin-like domain-containing protein [Novosphingobium sp. Gsoil 351]|uniref:cupin-like domain-containing protein n=1 Tax=Novosphingobium sp. Gsoil 351 TaxID=2675225 RepID=UPI0012B459B4|nr:cupin-like domain-containing protein [Novosphingobium sp. Gsoil 351]QGN56065.1 transcriptional regulator [Novosphingobium sp. Gsoil 351]